MHRKKSTRLLKALGLLAVLANAAYGGICTFSGEVSDDGNDVEVFDATVEFGLDTASGLLTIEVCNLTEAPNAYTVSELFFNVSDDVTGIELESAAGFDNAILIARAKAGGFGWFDCLFDFQNRKAGNANSGLAAGASAVLTFRFSGTDLDISDFFCDYATGGGKDKGDAVAALKFTQGPNDDSAYAIPNNTGAENRPPVITSEPVTAATENHPYAYQVVAEDPDHGDMLVYGLDAAPDGMAIGPLTGLIQWTPGSEDFGNHSVSVRACDLRGLADTQSFVITVTADFVTVPDFVGMDADDALALGLSLGLALGEVTYEYSDTMPKDHVISHDPPAGAQVPRGTAVNAVISLGTEYVTVPNIVGLNATDAEAAATEAGLRIGTVTTAYSETIPEGHVISQDPEGGTEVKRDSAVDAVQSLGPSPTVVVPEVVGTAQGDAEVEITRAALTVGAVSSDYSDTVPEGHVISQTPTAGTEVDRGSAVDLVISLGPELLEVPDFVGMDANDAVSLGESLGFTLGEVTYAYSDVMPRDHVIAQNPPPGTLVPVGTPIDGVVSLGRQFTTVPGVVGMYLNDADVEIAAADLVSEVGESVYSDTAPENTVISQHPVGGTVVAAQATVSLVVSLGPEMIEVPDVVGMPQADAEAAIVAAGLPVGLMEFTELQTTADGSVESQNPVAGMVVLKGTSVDLIVARWNRPPEVTDKFVHTTPNTPRDISLEVNDPDGDPLVYSVLMDPEHGVLSGEPPDLTFTPKQDYQGEDAFTYEVSDDHEHVAAAAVYVTVSGNLPPRITSMPMTVAYLNYTYAYPVAATDPDGDPLVYTLPTAPEGMSISPDGVIQWIPTVGQLNDYQVVVQVDDGLGGTDTQPYWVRVTKCNSGDNHVPIAHAGDDFTVKEGAQDELDATYSFDADGDRLSLTWVQSEGPPVELSSYSEAAPTFVAPEVNGNTLLTFELIVNDGTVDSEPDQVHVMVLNVSEPPEGYGIVTNSNLSGAGSLLAAIQYANANPGTHITFNVPDTDPCYELKTPGVWTLPTPSMGMVADSCWGGALVGILVLGDGTFVDGSSQTENLGDRNPFGPEIEIKQNTVDMQSFAILADNVVVQGLCLNGNTNTNAHCANAVFICSAANAVVVGNYLGTDPTGSRLGNRHGSPDVSFRGAWNLYGYTPPRYKAENCRIGGSRPGEGNLIGLGLDIAQPTEETWSWACSYTVQGNIFGLDRTGTTFLRWPDGTLPAGGGGFSFGGRNIDVTIGGVTPGSGNTVVNNARTHIDSGSYLLYGIGRVVVQGNRVGTDVTGSVDPLPGMQGVGVDISTSGPEVLIGGSVPGAGNLTSGLECGINLLGGAAGLVKILGNFIGTDATGTYAIPNNTGIAGRDTSPVVGGTEPGEGNVICGSLGWAVEIGQSAGRVGVWTLYGNKIGVGADGVTAIPNAKGIQIRPTTARSSVGGTGAGAGNVIAHCTGDAIYFLDASYYGRVTILGNSIHSNGGLPIRRAGDLTANDPGDADLFTRYMLNYPLITAVAAENGMTRIAGTLDSQDMLNTVIELFANREADPSGYGEGERWLAYIELGADGRFDTVIPEDLSGQYVTAIAARKPGPAAPTTSLFSRAVLVGDAVSTNEPPVISSAPVTSAEAGLAYAYQVEATDPEGEPLTYSLALAPAGMVIDASGLVTWTPEIEQEGRCAVTVVVRDPAGLYASQNYQLQVGPYVDESPPLVAVFVPTDLVIDQPYDLTGTISDPYLVWYGVSIAPHGTNEWSVIHEDTACVQNDVIGTIDPTRLANGTYDVRITAYDESGNLTVTPTSQVEVTGKLKIGQFSFAFNDITIPVSGIPITVQRTYDSFNKRQGDFGVGWNMALGTGVRIDVTRTLGNNWHAVEDYWWVNTWVYSLETSRVPKVLITYADGRQDRFEFTPDFVAHPAIDPRWVRSAFTPLGDTLSSLEIVGVGDLFLQDGMLFDLGAEEVGALNPDLYRLTLPDGTVLIISQSTGLKSIIDRSGNTLTFSPNGISHSSGKAIDMVRDDEGRISRITDPMGCHADYAYDERGDLASFTDQAGNLTQYGYDDNHNLISIIDARGIEILQTTYDDDGRMIATTGALGHSVGFVHDIGNAKEYVTDRNGNTTVYEYDADGNILAETDPLGNVTQYTYDTRGNTLSTTDPLGNTTAWTYDERDNKLSETDPLGNTRSWTYNAFGQVNAATDAAGFVTTYEYDNFGNLVGAEDPLGGRFACTYDGSGNLLTERDMYGATTTHEYDSHGNLLKTVDALGNAVLYEYDANGTQVTRRQLVTLDDGPVEATNLFEYDALNRLTRTVDPEGNQSGVEYDAAGKISATVDPMGNRVEFSYSPTGEVTLMRFPDGTETGWSYDANRNNTSYTDEDGRTTHYEYDALNRLTRTIYPDGTTSELEYECACSRRISARVDGNGNRTEYAYDAAGRLISVLDAAGGITEYEYDGRGNRTATTDANGNTTCVEYDAMNRAIRVVAADGTYTTKVYDAEQRRVEQTNALGFTTVSEYDALGRLAKIVDPYGGETSFDHNEMGNRTSLTSPIGHTTTWGYDANGRVVRHTLPLGMSETFHYDSIGNVLSRTGLNGNTTTYTYDLLKRPTGRSLPDGTVVSFTYSPSGNRDSATDARGTTSFQRDPRGRLIEVVGPDGVTLTYTYDSAGNRASVACLSGSTIYAYDAADRLESVTNSDGAEWTYAYDGVGNVASISLPNGLVTTYVYDSLNRLTRLETKDPQGGLVAAYTYTLDPAGRRTTCLEEPDGRLVTYAYDALNRLTDEAIVDPTEGPRVLSYTYAASGNRLSKTDSAGGTTVYVYDANDRLLSETGPEGMTVYTYDNSGNVVQKVGPGGLFSYAYNAADQLVAVSDGVDQYEYSYDFDGARVRSLVNGAQAANFLVDKNRPYSEVLRQTDDTGEELASFVYGTDLLRMDRPESGERFYLYDGQLSARFLTDSSGNVTDGGTYDAFGNALSSFGATSNNNKFAGEYSDAETGFYYLRARYYDPSVGRFTSRDPRLVHATWMLHPYAYVDNNPVNMWDPSGELAEINALTSTLATQAVITEIVAWPGRALDWWTSNVTRLSYKPDFLRAQNLALQHWKGLYTQEITVFGLTRDDARAQIVKDHYRSAYTNMLDYDVKWRKRERHECRIRLDLKTGTREQSIACISGPYADRSFTLSLCTDAMRLLWPKRDPFEGATRSGIILHEYMHTIPEMYGKDDQGNVTEAYPGILGPDGSSPFEDMTLSGTAVFNPDHYRVQAQLNEVSFSLP